MMQHCTRLIAACGLRRLWVGRRVTYLTFIGESDAIYDVNIRNPANRVEIMRMCCLLHLL